MKHINILGYVSIVCVVTLAGQCDSQTTGIPIDLNVTTENIKPTSRNQNGSHEDDFVPYEGERSSSFDWMLFRALGRKQSGNFVFSPISLKIALILLYEGAEDVSAYEIASIMQLPVNETSIREKYSNILRSLQVNSTGYSLNIGSRVYIDSNILIRQQYGAILKSFYDTDVIPTNLSDARVVIKNVNEWISNITNGNIKDILEDENKVRDSLMLMINAIFFKGSWYRKYFSTKDTQNGPFYIDSNRTVQVPFMHATSRFHYSESSELGAKILRLPYEGNKFALYLILPRTRDGIEQLINEINQFHLMKHILQMQNLPIDVMIPKFKFAYSVHLEPILRELGIRDIFDDTATLTGITITKRTSKRLKVTDILQKAGIEVNENGTTAYASTVVEIENKINDETFHANHPFVFFIEDESTGTILYVGRVTNPTDTSENEMPVMKLHIQSYLGTEIPDADSNLQIGLKTNDRDNLFNTYFTQNVGDELLGNFISSPASIKAVLTMLTDGSCGHTRTEIVSTLRLPDNESRIRETIKHLLTFLKKNENGMEIDLSTCFWIDQKLNLFENYKNILYSHYMADIKTVNFSNSQSVARDINSWVREATHAQISSPLINNVPPNTQLLLTSIIYFKGKWLKAFDKMKTKLECFYVPNGECRNTYFMTHKSSYRYAYISSIDAEVLEIPYSDGRTSMLAIIPNKGKKDPYLRILSKDLATIPISVMLANLVERSLTIYVPKFSIENNLNLVPTLQCLGIESIFKSTANLTRITSNGTLHVTSILQNVKIIVDEEGTLAAADTEIAFEFLALWNNDIKLDKPFLFLIVDSVTNTTLFSGRFMEPLL